MASGDGRDWNGVSYRRYAYTGLDVDLPPLKEFLIIAYLNGQTPVHRKVDCSWRDEDCGVRDVTLLTRASRSQWSWSEAIEVSHVYLNETLVEETANEVFGRQVSDVRLRDILRTKDAGISRCAATIGAEASEAGIGGNLIVEAAARELAVRLLRRYAEAEFVSDEKLGGLTPTEKKRVETIVQEKLSEKISYTEVASQLGIGPWTFSRRFKISFGCTFHEYVIIQRVAEADEKLRRSDQPMKLIAHECGFFDQPHMNRAFRKIKGQTPGQIRSFDK